MKSNVGGIDKIARIILGAVLLGVTIAGLLPAWGYIGIVPLVTGLFGWCPAYRLIGLNTCPMRD